MHRSSWRDGMQLARSDAYFASQIGCDSFSMNVTKRDPVSLRDFTKNKGIEFFENEEN